MVRSGWLTGALVIVLAVPAWAGDPELEVRPAKASAPAKAKPKKRRRPVVEREEREPPPAAPPSLDAAVVEFERARTFELDGDYFAAIMQYRAAGKAGNQQAPAAELAAARRVQDAARAAEEKERKRAMELYGQLAQLYPRHTWYRERIKKLELPDVVGKWQCLVSGYDPTPFRISTMDAAGNVRGTVTLPIGELGLTGNIHETKVELTMGEGEFMCTLSGTLSSGQEGRARVEGQYTCSGETYHAICEKLGP